MKSGVAVTIAVLFVVGAGIFAIAGRYEVQPFKDKHASGGEMRSPLQSVFAHLNQEFYLTVNGKTFRDVRGTVPFYLDVPQLDSILFVTGTMDHPAIFHVCGLKSKRELTIDGGPIGFGWDIGGAKKQGEPWTVYVSNVSSNEITLVWRDDIARDLIVLEMGSRRVKPNPNSTR